MVSLSAPGTPIAHILLGGSADCKCSVCSACRGQHGRAVSRSGWRPNSSIHLVWLPAVIAGHCANGSRHNANANCQSASPAAPLDTSTH